MLSLSITAYEETGSPSRYGQGILKCIRPAQEHDAVDEIVVVDDGSADFGKLLELLGDQPKVKLFHNRQNLGVFTNKIEAVARAGNEWVVTCDSDNIMEKSYLDQVVQMQKDPDTWYCPSFAKPRFDYRKLVGTYDRGSVAELLGRPLALCAINTGNQVVHRDSFMTVFGKYLGHKRFDLMLPNYLDLPEAEREEERWWLAYGANDSCILNMLWMFNAGRICLVPGLEYDHYISEDPQGSNFERAPAEKGRVTMKLVEILRGDTP